MSYSGLSSPAIAFIDFSPRLFSVAQLLLDLLNFGLVAGVFAHVITQLHGWPTIRGGDLDDDIEGLGFLTIGFVGEII